MELAQHCYALVLSLVLFYHNAEVAYSMMYNPCTALECYIALYAQVRTVYIRYPRSMMIHCTKYICYTYITPCYILYAHYRYSVEKPLTM